MFSMKKPAMVLIIFSLLIMVSSLFSSCTKDASSSVSQTASSTTTASSSSVKKGSSPLAKLLELVPSVYATDAEQPVFVIVTDYATLYKKLGISFDTPEDMAYATNQDTFLRQLANGSFITGYGGQYALLSTIRKEYVGYDLTCIDGEITFGFPPSEGVAAIGRFNAKDVAKALKNQNGWPDWAISDYATEEYNGVTIHSWGDGLQIHLQDRIAPPLIDQLGRARPLAVTDEYLFYHPSMDVMRLMIDASKGKTPSLADVPGWAEIADTMAELNAYKAIIAVSATANGFFEAIESEDLGWLKTEENRQFVKANIGPRLKNFIVFGSGMGRDDKGQYIALAIYHNNPEDAKANVSLLEQRIQAGAVMQQPGQLWKDIITGTDIEVDGNLLTAKLYVQSAAIALSWIYAQDSLLIHEE